MSGQRRPIREELEAVGTEVNTVIGDFEIAAEGEPCDIRPLSCRLIIAIAKRIKEIESASAPC